jgi:phytoene dehydrogenase-like protein
MSREPHALALFLEDPLEVSGKKYERLDIEIFNFDKNLAPPGKTVIKVMFGASYGYWKDLRADRERYEYQKQEIARAVIDRLDKRFPGLKGQVEMVDVATPVTFENYTGNWKGLQAWMPPDGGFGTMMNGFTRSLPGLDNFYMAGQWAEAMIGISTAALSGRNLVRHLCKKYKRSFVTK